MKKYFGIILMLVLGAALLLAAWFWSGQEIQMCGRGQTVTGTIDGMVKVHANSVDLVTRLEHTLRLVRANGEICTITFSNYLPTAATITMNQSQADIPREVLEGKADDIRFPKTVAETVKDLSRADADTLKRRLQREAKHGGPEAITRIEKTETAYGFFALPKMPHQFVHQAGELRPVETTPAGLAVTRAVFDLKAAEASTNRNETMTAYTRTLNGVEVSPTKRDFILFDEAFACEFRPVFHYSVGGTNHFGLADIGRHGAPSPVFGLFGNCRVAFDPAQPERAILLPDFGTVKFSTSPLAWFSSASEGFFSRWVYLFTLVTIGAGLITISLIAISLVLKPSVRLQTGAEEKPPS